MKKFFFSSLIIVFTIIFDQWSKQFFASIADQHSGTYFVNSYLNIVKLWNKGVSFGMFSNSQNANIIFAIISSIIIIALTLMLKKSKSKLTIIAYSMMIAGAAGNVIDRLRFGAVIDFIDLHYKNYHWPAFNIADSAIFISVIIILFFSQKK